VVGVPILFQASSVFGCAGSAVGAGGAAAVYGNVHDEIHDQLEEKYAPTDDQDSQTDAEDRRPDGDADHENESVATSEASSHPEVVKSLIRTGSIGTTAAVAAVVAAATAAAASSKGKTSREKSFFKMTLDLSFEEAGIPGTTKRKLFERAVIDGSPLSPLPSPLSPLLSPLSPLPSPLSPLPLINPRPPATQS